MSLIIIGHVKYSRGKHQNVYCTNNFRRASRFLSLTINSRFRTNPAWVRTAYVDVTRCSAAGDRSHGAIVIIKKYFENEI